MIDLIDSLEKLIFENKQELNSLEYNFIYILSLNFSDLIAGFLVLYTYLKMKSISKEKEIKKTNKNNKNAYELIYNDLSIKRNKYYLILLISALNFVPHLCLILYNLFMPEKNPDKHDMDWVLTIDIFMRILFTKVILKKNFYKHHKLGLILNGIGFLFLTIVNIKRIYFGEYSKPIEAWIYFLFMLPQFIFFPLEEVINKILLMDKFILPHSLMFMRGIIEFLFNIILSIILFSTSQISFEEIQIIFSDIHKIFRLILGIIFQFFRYFIIMKVIYIFNPTYVTFLAIVDVIIDIINKLFIVKMNSFDFFFFLVCLSSFIIFLGALIFNEIIIINAYGLEEGTKEGLLNRESIDKMGALELNDSTFNDETNINEDLNDDNNNTRNNNDNSF
jgi:hypothetical protein